MTEYRAPIDDMRFVLSHVAGLDRLAAIERFAHADAATIAGLLGEAGRFASEVIAPLNRIGDRVGSIRSDDGVVTTPPGYRDAYRRFVEAGWPAAAFPEEWGGGGLPWTVGLAIQEMVTSADMAFSLCPMLTYSANELLISHGTDELHALFLEKMVAGQWSGTMALTEPQAGSDVGALTTRAVPAADGTYRVTGTKIFITWGEHDMADNIVHLVLARLPDAPAGTRGISTFVVPKFLPTPHGTLGDRNDVTCVSIEHKVGIHASPTCVLSFGEKGEGAVGYLVGEENRGLRSMFTMMNNARLSVGLEGLAIAERSYQEAVAYARQRVQGHAVGDKEPGPSPIIRHADVRRDLMLMRSQIEAMRCVMYRNAGAIDLANHHPDDAVRAAESELAGLLIPVSKAWGTDLGVELTSLGIQVHGGSGYVEEIGAAQWWRDSRIAPIYEGTNGIQAEDLVSRKLPQREGAAIRDLIASMRADASQATGDLAVIQKHLAAAVDAVESATDTLLALWPDRARDALAGSTAYTRMLGTTVGGWLLARSAAAADNAEGFTQSFITAKSATAMFYAEHVLSTVPGMLATVTAGADTVFGVAEEEM